MFVRQNCAIEARGMCGKACVVLGETIGEGTEEMSWGFCSKKKRLPSKGFQYDETILKASLQVSLSTLLSLYPGCASRPLEVTNNVAGSLGGGMYISDCDKSAQRFGKCSVFNGQANSLPSMHVVFQGNHAGLAGGGVFVNCPEMSPACNESLRVRLGLPKFQSPIFVNEGNTADGYGENLGLAPIRLLLRVDQHQYVPGRATDVLQFAVALLDQRKQHVKGSNTKVNPYQVSLEFCPPDADTPCSAKEQIQDSIIFRLHNSDTWTKVKPLSLMVKHCLAEFSTISMHILLDDKTDISSVDTLHSSFSAHCLPCGPGEMRTESIDALGRLMWACTPCLVGEFILDNNNPLLKCQKCPKGALCDSKTFKGLVDGSEWVETGGHMRVQACPAGYILVRGVDPVADECIKCPAGACINASCMLLYVIVPSNLRLNVI